MSNSLDTDQTAPIGAVFSGSTLFASILNASVMLGNYLQQTTFVVIGPLKLTLNMPIATKVVCFSRLLQCLRSLYGKQYGPRSWSGLFASIFNASVMLGSYLQQTTSADNIFRCIFFLAR